MGLPAPYDRLLIPVYLPSAFTAVANQAMLLLLPLYALQISGSVTFAALVMGLRGLGVLLFDVPAGLLIGRFGDKSVLLGGLVTLAASMLGLAMATEQWAIALLAVPLGAAHAAWFLGWLTYITHSCPPELRGRATAVNAGIQRLGAFVGPLAGGIVAESLGYPAAYLAAAVLCGLGNGLSTGLVMIIGMDLSPPGQRGQFLGVWRLIGDAGWVGGPLLTGLMVEVLNLAAASFFAAGLGVLGGLVLLFLVPETSHLPREHDSAPP